MAKEKRNARLMSVWGQVLGRQNVAPGTGLFPCRQNMNKIWTRDLSLCRQNVGWRPVPKPTEEVKIKCLLQQELQLDLEKEHYLKMLILNLTKDVAMEKYERMELESLLL